MAIPESTKRDAERHLAAFCEQRVPPSVRDQMYLEHASRGNDLTIFERNAPWRDEAEEWMKRPVVLFRWNSETAAWILKWPDRNGKWLAYPGRGPFGEFALALREVDADPHACFWG